MARVVITGISATTALGDDWSTFKQNLKKQQNAVQYIPQWDEIAELNTRLAAPVEHFEKPSHFSRKKIRSMGRVSLMATAVTEKALAQAGLLEHDLLASGNVGVAFGSSSGSTSPITAFGKLLTDNDMTGVTSTSYIQMMAHTTAVNIGVFFGIKGRIYTTSSACTSGSQAIGYAYEAIKNGQQTIMVAGGAEELCVTGAAIFDTLFATTTKNETPKQTPSPYDKDRDGLVVGEGACSFILESYDSAVARGAEILAEIVGYGTNSDGQHVTQPSSDTMQIAMELALKMPRSVKM